MESKETNWTKIEKPCANFDSPRTDPVLSMPEKVEAPLMLGQEARLLSYDSGRRDDRRRRRQPIARRGVSIGALPDPDGSSQVRWTPVTRPVRSVTAAIIAGHVSTGACASG